MNFVMINLLFAFAFSRPASAQEMGLATSRTEHPVPIVALTQYVEGHSMRTEASGEQTDLIYGVPLYDGDRIEMTAGSLLKLATRSGCIIVLQGRGALLAPKSAGPVTSRTFRMRATDSSRVICGAGHADETFRIGVFDSATASFSLATGEVLVRGDRAMLVNGAATLRGKPLEPRTVVSLVNGAPVEMSGDQLRSFDLDAKPPRESYRWPQPEKKRSTRLMFGALQGAEILNYDYPALSQRGLKEDGARLQAQVRTENGRAVIAAISVYSAQDHSRQGAMNSPPPAGVDNEVDTVLVEIGERFQADRWWSPYFRVGGGYEKAKIGFESENFSYSRYGYEFYVLSAAYGIDAHWTPLFLKPIGFFASAEGQVLQSILRGGRINENSGFYQSANAPPEPWRLTTVNLSLNFGLELFF